MGEATDSFGARLRRLREAAALTQEELAVLAAERGNLAQAAAVLEQRLATAAEPQTLPLDGQLMATVAVVGAACGAAAPAARIFGVTAALHAVSGERFRLPERLVYERAMERLRCALGSDADEHLVAEGRAMPDEAVATRGRVQDRADLGRDARRS